MHADYRRIPVWETNRRIRVLKEYIRLVAEYATLSSKSEDFETREQADTTRQQLSARRMDLDIQLQNAEHVVQGSGISPLVTWSPPPMVGGYPHQVDLMADMFQLEQHGIDFSALSDVLLRAMGVYQQDKTAAWLRTLNPFYWISVPIEWASYLPFRIIGFLGQDADRASQSLLGRTIQGVLVLGQTVAVYLGIAEKFGLLQVLKRFLQDVFR